MDDATQIRNVLEQGGSAEELLPLVYDELRRLAARQLAEETPGQTLQPTALVHEVYLRVRDAGQSQNWNSRGHFFAACAEAMRRILIDNARRKQADKRGGGRRRVDFEHAEAVAAAGPDELLALDDALERLCRHDPTAGQLVRLRSFGGLSVEEAADALGLSRATAYRLWAFARAWLSCQLAAEGPDPTP